MLVASCLYLSNSRNSEPLTNVLVAVGVVVLIIVIIVCTCKMCRNPRRKYLSLQKLKIHSLSGHPTCRWVCFFVGTDLIKCSINTNAYQCILCREWVPSEWESKQLIKTIKITQKWSTPLQFINYVLWIKAVFVRNKSIIKTFLTSNSHFWSKYL